MRSSGNGGRANAARLSNPGGLASAADAPDGGGGWLIADTNNGWIRRVFANSTIIAVVGNGSNAAGDDGLPGAWVCGCATYYIRAYMCSCAAASRTLLNFPVGVSAFDPSGSFYVSDTVNRVVRRIFPNGTTRIVAGSLGVAGVTGNNVPGTAALCNYPRALTISGADLVIADSGASVVRILYENQTLSTVMGSLGTVGSTGERALSCSGAPTFYIHHHILPPRPLRHAQNGSLESRGRGAW